jgi:hypothetical protein
VRLPGDCQEATVCPAPRVCWSWTGRWLEAAVSLVARQRKTRRSARTVVQRILHPLTGLRCRRQRSPGQCPASCLASRWSFSREQGQPAPHPRSGIRGPP